MFMVGQYLRKSREEKGLSIVRSEKGFTLVEALIGFTLLAIVMLGFLTLFAAGSRLNRAVDDNTKAFYLAESYIERIYAESSKKTPEDIADDLNFSQSGEEYKKTDDNFHLRLKFTESEGLHKVLIKVYEDEDTSSKQLAQIEDIFKFK